MQQGPIARVAPNNFPNSISDISKNERINRQILLKKSLFLTSLFKAIRLCRFKFKSNAHSPNIFLKELLLK